MKNIYVDTSAAIKQIIEEAESGALTDYLSDQVSQGARLISSVLLDVELARVGVRENIPHSEHIAPVVAQFHRITIGADVIEQAVRIPTHVRALDAIHLATALLVASSPLVFVTYDRQLGAAANSMGLNVVTPGSPFLSQ